MALAVVVLFGAALVLPRPAARVVTPDAHAQLRQPTPNLTDILKTPKPSSSPTEEDPGPGGGGGEEDPGGGGGNNNGGSGGNNSNGSGGNDGEGGDKNDGRNKDKNGRNQDGRNDGPGDKRNGRNKRNRNKDPKPAASIAGRIPGSYNTNELVAVAAHLRSLGMSQSEVIRRVYPPFIIAGNSSWIDTWGAPRYGPAPGQIRTHEGQDVFCDFGDPILAPEPGTLSFDDGGLGGITARVHRPDGSYWYLTHLSDLNTEQFSPGDHVNVGDIVGYCGNSGNALTTPPHVHFGWYQPNGNAKNPMKHLVSWLHQAERRVLGVVTKTITKRVKKVQSGELTTERLFGDWAVPDRSELSIPIESLWASGSYPASGAFGVAESALQSALSAGESGYSSGISGLPLQVSDEGSLDPSSELAKLLEDSHNHTDSETGD